MHDLHSDIALANRDASTFLLVFVHVIASFAFLAFVMIAGCLFVMWMDNDPGGPLFLPIAVMVAVFVAAIIASALECAVFVSKVLRRVYECPLWLPPLAVFALTTALSFGLYRIHLALPAAAGTMATLAFTLHWTAVEFLSLIVSYYTIRGAD